MRSNFFLAFLSAFLLVLAFPRTDWWLLAWISFVPLLIALEFKTFWQSFRVAYLSGFIFFAGTLYWIIHVTLLGCVLLIAFLSLYYGIFGMAVYFSQRMKPILRLFFLPSAWVVLEYIRAHFLTGFGWAGLGYSQYKDLPVIQVADITGVYGISFLVMMVNCGVKEIFIDSVGKYKIFLTAENFFPTQQRRYDERSEEFFCKKGSRQVFGITSGILLTVVIYGLVSLFITKPGVNSKITIATIQANIPQELKWHEAAWPMIMDKYKKITKEAAQSSPSLIVWPETSFPGYLWHDQAMFDELRYFVKGLKVPLLVGAVIEKEGSYYNAAFLLSPNGEIIKEYDKLHLVPFGEYIPLRRYMPILTNIIPIGDFSPGKEFTVFPWSASEPMNRFSVLICFEDGVAELPRGFVNNGAGFLINITNDAWFKDTKAPFMHLQTSVFRAVENRRSVVRSANTGVSGFIDRWGRITDLLQDEHGKKTFVEGYAITTIEGAAEKTFYTKFGDVFTIFCFVCILWTIFICRSVPFNNNIFKMNDDQRTTKYG